MATIKVIILAGGFGKRLSPLSTAARPKQFLDLTGSGISLFQAALARALEITQAANIFPVGNITHKQIIIQQLGQNHEIAENVIFEDEPRNTAHAIALALAKIGGGIVVVLPSDHDIDGDFLENIQAAIELAKTGKIVTFGIKPAAADSNFGYVLENSFYEKPSEYEAEKLIDKGALWNSGIFVFATETALGEFAKYYGNNITDIPPLSFDKAIMEKTAHLAVIEAGFEWADLGSFAALENYPKAV